MMAYTKPHSLSQVERDMRGYATHKAYVLMKDVLQSFNIAGLSNEQAAACLGALFMRLAATIACNHKPPLKRENFIRFAEENYDGSKEINDLIPD